MHSYVNCIIIQLHKSYLIFFLISLVVDHENFFVNMRKSLRLGQYAIWKRFAAKCDEMQI